MLDTQQFLRGRENAIVFLEEESVYPARDGACHLWFFDDGLTGYSWFVPKGESAVNVGIGSKLSRMQAKGQTIRDHWEHFQSKLEQSGLVTAHDFQPKGHQYYLRGKVDVVQAGRAYLIGDAAGLATSIGARGLGQRLKAGSWPRSRSSAVDPMRPVQQASTVCQAFFWRDVSASDAPAPVRLYRLISRRAVNPTSHHAGARHW